MAKSKKATAIAGTVIVTVLGTEDIEGNVVLNETNAVITRKKPRSPKKTLTSSYPLKIVLAVSEGEEGFVTVRSQVEILSVDVADVHPAGVSDEDRVTITDDEGNITVVMLADGVTVNTEAETDTSDSETAVKAGKKKPAKEEEDEDEDEEEEKPAKKKPAKAKVEDKKAAGKKKPAKEDDDWE